MFSNLPEMLSAKDIMNILPVSRSAVYSLLRDPTFPTIRLGRRIIVPRDALCIWLKQNLEGNISLPADPAMWVQPVKKEPVITENPEESSQATSGQGKFAS